MQPVDEDAALNAAAERRWVSGDVKGNTITDAGFTTILKASGSHTMGYAAGYVDLVKRNFQGGSDMVIKDSNANELDADTLVRAAVYRSTDEEELVATSRTIRYGRLSNAKSNSKMEDKVATELLDEVATEDRVLVMEAKLPSGVSDFTPDSANCASDLGIAYSKVPL
jgi:hypothetical protein